MTSDADRRLASAPGSWTPATILSMVALAAFPVVPMPIAGGTPIAIALMLFLATVQAGGRRGISFDRSDWVLILATLLLFALEGLTYARTGLIEDGNYFFARGYWMSLAIIVILACNAELRRGNLLFVPNALVLGLILLLIAMALESRFFPRFEQGRDFGNFNLPWPRATGVPNSDGKIGTFLSMTFAFALFYRPRMQLWKRALLLGGPVVGLAFTQSRSGLVSMAVVFAMHWVYRAFVDRNFLLLSLRWLAMVAGGLFILYNVGLLVGSLVGQGIYQQNVLSRFSQYFYAFDRIGDAPFLGSGSSAIRQYEQYAGVHNTVLAMSLKSGIIAGALALMLILAPASGMPGGSPRFLVYKWATALALLAEHMLYPGFINEFLIIGYVLVKSVWWAERGFAPAVRATAAGKAPQPQVRQWSPA